MMRNTVDHQKRGSFHLIKKIKYEAYKKLENFDIKPLDSKNPALEQTAQINSKECRMTRFSVS
jgi:hypothetical protein